MNDGMRARRIQLPIWLALLCACAPRPTSEKEIRFEEFIALINLLEEHDAPMDFFYESIWTQGDRCFLLGLAEERPVQAPKIAEFLTRKADVVDSREAIDAARLLACLKLDADIFNRVAEREAKSQVLQWWGAQDRPETPAIAVRSCFEHVSLITRFSRSEGLELGPPTYRADVNGGVLGVVMTVPSEDAGWDESLQASLQAHLNLAFGIEESSVHVGVLKVKRPSTRSLAEVVFNSPSVKSYASRIAGKPTMIVDRTGESECVVAVGEMMETHFTRGLTLRVRRDGRTEVLENNQGEEEWRFDYAPDGGVDWK